MEKEKGRQALGQSACDRLRCTVILYDIRLHIPQTPDLRPGLFQYRPFGAVTPENISIQYGTQ